jgi:hypothetical protein
MACGHQAFPSAAGTRHLATRPWRIGSPPTVFLRAAPVDDAIARFPQRLCSLSSPPTRMIPSGTLSRRQRIGPTREYSCAKAAFRAGGLSFCDRLGIHALCTKTCLQTKQCLTSLT